MIKIAFSLFIILISCAGFSREELAVIQTVSKDKKSFILQRGLRDGLMIGNEMIFGNDNVSIVCRIVEISKDYSLWKPIDSLVSIPFSKLDIVAINSHTYGNISVDVANNKVELMTKEMASPNSALEKYKELDRLQNEITAHHFSIFYSFGSSFMQSSSSLSSNQTSKKQIENYTFEYGHQFTNDFELTTGIKVDRSLYRISSPSLDIPTTRYLLTGGLLVRPSRFNTGRNIFYMGFNVGIGTSSTTVNNTSSKGTAYLLPGIRSGMVMPFSATSALLFEVSIDSMSSREKFPAGDYQDNNDVSGKISLGLKF